MIDITTVNPNRVPPEIQVLQSENYQLKQENTELSKQSMNIIAIAFISVIIGSVLAMSLNNKQDENEK